MSIYLVTGCAGFIGARTAETLLQKGHTVVGVDNLNDYYDVRLKKYRLSLLRDGGRSSLFVFHKLDIEDEKALNRLFKKYTFDAVVNLAARAGARYSIENPYIYSTTNIHAALNLLEACREFKVKKFVLASSSSLYAGQTTPFKETMPVNEPISPYAASKKAAEVMAYTYHYLYGIDISILRYFTVYGPAGRPDMSPFRFTRWIAERQTVQLFGDGNQSRDFTYVDDIASGTVRALKKVGFEIINLGGGKRPVTINSMIALIEKYTSRKAKVRRLDVHKADVDSTWADISKAKKLLNWEPKVEFEEGIRRTVEWYLDNHAWARNINSK